MKFRAQPNLLLSTLLAAAAVICLMVGLQLLTAGSVDEDLRRTARLAMAGGLAVFVLGTAALLAARRFARGSGGPPADDAVDLQLVDVQNWGRELSEIRDDLRRRSAAGPSLDSLFDQPGSPAIEVQLHAIEVPAGWRPEGRYLNGRGDPDADPVADLKRTRDELLAVAERVDLIVKSIADITVKPCPTSTSISVWSRLIRRFGIHPIL